MKKKKIYLSLATMGGDELKYVQEAFDTDWVAPLGPNVDKFEETLSSYLEKEKHIVCLSSGTAAIHLALLQLGVSYGDEVICQSFTFVASANPIKYLGAEPVFVDSEPDTWNMDPNLLEEAIEDRISKTGKKPRAIIFVHLYGMPAKIHEIMAVAQKYDIPVIEDAAEALGSSYDGQQCGTFGYLASLSFNGNKIITTSGGGALICPTKDIADKTKFYATQARDKAPHYQHSEVGFNYRMSNVCAGIGRGQMKMLDTFVERRRAINAYYKDKLKDCPGISFLTAPSEKYAANHWLTCVQIDETTAGFNRKDLLEAMEQHDIETRPLWKPMHLQPVFSANAYYGNGVSESLFEKGLCLPSGSSLSHDDLNEVIAVIKSMYRK